MRTGPRFGVYGVGLQLALALGLGVLASQTDASQLGPPEAIPRGLTLGLLFAVPGVIAALGIRGGRAALLIAAAAMDAFSPLLSYATVVFVVPVGLFVAHAAAVGKAPATIGAVVRSTLLVVALVGLVIGGVGGLLATTEGRCWAAYSTPTGIEYRYSPYVEGAELGLAPGAIGEGCRAGLLSAPGEAIAAVLSLGAIALAGLATRRRRQPVSG